MSKLVILDRDGVINLDSDQYVKSEAEWIPIDGSIEAISRLSRAGYQVVVATNQSGLGRGLFDLDDLEAMHQKLNDLVEQAGGEVSGVFYCPHTPDDGCGCRKPLPGLLQVIADEFQTNLNGVPLVGDSLRDLQAGLAVGCRPVLVRTGKGEKTLSQLSQHPELANTEIYNNLAAFADTFLENRTQS